MRSEAHAAEATVEYVVTTTSGKDALLALRVRRTESSCHDRPLDTSFPHVGTLLRALGARDVQVHCRPEETRKQKHIVQHVWECGPQSSDRSRPLRKFADGSGKGMVARPFRGVSRRNMQ